MKELYTRMLSGAVYVALLIAGILLSKYSLILLFTVLSTICLFEFQQIIHFKKLILYPILIGGLVFAHFTPIPKEITWGVLLATIITQLFLLKDLLFIRIIPMFEKKKYLVSGFYLITCSIFITLIPFDNYGNYTPSYLLGMFILIWVNDSFAYLVGKNLGKRKLYVKISPKKTIEGFLGGLFFCILTGILISKTTNSLTTTHWVIISLIIGVFGTIGDLIQSKFKRQAGVKDSGTIMPGHGGIFDRLDSVLYAAPFVFLYLQFI